MAKIQGRLFRGRGIGSHSETLFTEIHAFSDASEKALGAVGYLKTKAFDETPAQLVLISAKTKVVPLKKVSIPRLELYAALLPTRLVI